MTAAGTATYLPMKPANSAATVGKTATRIADKVRLDSSPPSLEKPSPASWSIAGDADGENPDKIYFGRKQVRESLLVWRRPCSGVRRRVAVVPRAHFIEPIAVLAQQGGSRR
jgi:hypothetical protein